MKQFFIPLLFFLLLPSLCCAAFIIHLKNGSKFETTSYWKEGQTVKFTYRGGEMGLDKHLISSIEYTEEILTDTPHPKEILPQKAKQEPAPSPKTEKKKEPQKKKRSANRKVRLLQKRFRYLKEQYGNVKSMSDQKAISLTKKMLNFRDVANREKLYEEFQTEILEIYSMIDDIEKELNSRKN